MKTKRELIVEGIRSNGKVSMGSLFKSFNGKLSPYYYQSTLDKLAKTKQIKFVQEDKLMIVWIAK